MQDKATRRQFLKVAGMSGAALSVGNFGFLEKVPPVSAQEARVTPALVKLDAGIEPLVRLIEDTPGGTARASGSAYSAGNHVSTGGRRPVSGGRSQYRSAA